MRYCPVCDARYNDDVIKFCTKDGTPLVDDAAPNFTALPSDPIVLDVEDEVGEETIIRRRPTEPAVPETQTEREAERIVIPTEGIPRVPSEPQIRPRTQTYYQPPPPQNTVKIVVLTILGTLVILACGAGLFWLLSSGKPAANNVNLSVNANQNVNLNTNLGFDSNFNFNAGNSATVPNLNTNISTIGNISTNANLKPSPTPKPSPSPTPRSSPTGTPYEVGNELKPTPEPTITPRMGPRPPANATNANKPRNTNN
jgi:hypothetical protein